MFLGLVDLKLDVEKPSLILENGYGIGNIIVKASDNQGTSVVADQNAPGTSTAVQETPTDLILPEDILPIPGAKTRTSNRGRKPTRANVITSSPYKNQLTESLRLAETRGQGRRGGRRRGRGRGLGRSQGGVCSSNKANRRQNVDTSSSSSESDAIIETDSEYDEQVNSDTPESLDTSCIFCGMNYSSDTHGEEWIQCLSCSLWAHTACAGPEGENYICDFCR
ncbi:hypothetical protein FQA39_LY10623 [Lamprigera yunnana]|nr:hypothetical protein FQA39_LY10623 [Lamprigera yunnana]